MSYKERIQIWQRWIFSPQNCFRGKLIDRWVCNSRHRVLYGSNILLCGCFPYSKPYIITLPISNFLSLWGMLSWTGWLLSLGGLFWLGRKDRACILALLCLFVYLMPSSSFAPLKEHMAEHRSLPIWPIFDCLHHVVL